MAAPEIAWNQIAAEFADEYGPLSPQQVASAVLTSARAILVGRRGRMAAETGRSAAHRLLADGFAALAADGHALPSNLAARLANRFTTYREEAMFVFPARMTLSTRSRHTGSSWRW